MATIARNTSVKTAEGEEWRLGSKSHQGTRPRTSHRQSYRCLTRIRRGFTKALDVRKRDAARITHLMGYLYQDQDWVRTSNQHGQSGLALRAAIRASHSSPRLKTYLQDGRVEIDTNLIENSIRTLGPGRKERSVFRITAWRRAGLRRLYHLPEVIAGKGRDCGN